MHGRGKLPHTPSARSVASLPRFGPPLTNPGWTTGTGIAIRGTRAHAPLDWSKKLKEGDGEVICTWHDLYVPLHIITYTKKEAILIHEISKISLPWWEGTPPPTPPPPLGRFAPRGGGGVLRCCLDGGAQLKPPNPYPSLRVILAEKGTHY